MIAARYLRRAAIFVVLFGTGMAVLVVAAGGFRVDAPADPRPAVRADMSHHALVPLDKGSGLGPGRGGRLDRDDVAIVTGRPVRYRELTAEWETSEPLASRDPGVRLLQLGGARISFFPRPSTSDPAGPPADGTGTTAVSGQKALLRQREGSPASAHLEGDCVATHRVGPGDDLTLRSEALDVRTEERGVPKMAVHVVETDLPVRIEGGGSVVTGTGLVAELDSGRGKGSRRVVRIRKDVAATIRNRTEGDGSPPRRGRNGDVRCAGEADVEALDKPGRDGRQPWRATFRDDVRFDDGMGTLTAEEVVIDFVRTGTADRAAGAQATEIRGLTATGKVRIDGTTQSDGSEASSAKHHVECERLRRFAEDALTDVTILEGSPLLRWEGRPQSAAPASKDGAAPATGHDAPLSTYQVRCTGPATMRERRSAAAKDAAANVTITFEGDVEATEHVVGSDTLRTSVRAPRVTIECRRAADGRLDPRLVRAEQGATARFEDLDVRAQSIVAEAPQKPGAPQRIVLTGSPAASYALAEGANPLGGKEPAGRVVLTSGTKVEIDLAPEPPEGRPTTGTRVAARASGGMVLRKMVGEDESWRLTAKEGDAKVGWDGGIEEAHAVGAARLSGRGAVADKRAADLSGSRISLVRRGTAPKKEDALRLLDALVESAPGERATAVFTDGADDARRHEVRADTLSYGEGGTVVLARGAARANLYMKSAPDARPDGMTLDADEIRIDLTPKDGGRGEARLVTATGKVTLRDAMHTLTGDRVVYDPLHGAAEASGKPARVQRVEDPSFPSYAAGTLLRAWFDPKAEGEDRFLRASLPNGGEVVAYRKKKTAHERVTTTCRGPLEVTRTGASCVQEVVSIFERSLPTGAWSMDSRIDCRRLEMTFDPASQSGQPSERIRTLVATGTTDDPARIRTRSPTGDREAYAEAERVRCDPGTTRMRLDCPGGKGSVTFHDIAKSMRARCESIDFDYETYEWKDAVLWRVLEGN